MRLRQNPHSVHEWHRRVKIFEDQVHPRAQIKGQERCTSAVCKLDEEHVSCPRAQGMGLRSEEERCLSWWMLRKRVSIFAFASQTPLSKRVCASLTTRVCALTEEESLGVSDTKCLCVT